MNIVTDGKIHELDWLCTRASTNNTALFATSAESNKKEEKRYTIKLTVNDHKDTVT